VAGIAELDRGASGSDDLPRKRCGDLVFLDYGSGRVRRGTLALDRPLREDIRHNVRRAIVRSHRQGRGSGFVIDDENSRNASGPITATRGVTAAPLPGCDPAVTIDCDKEGRNRLGAERRSGNMKRAFDGMK
jgi:hypothetical protein